MIPRWVQIQAEDISAISLYVYYVDQLNECIYNLQLQSMMIQVNKKQRNADETKEWLLHQDLFYPKSHQPPLPEPQPTNQPLHLLVHTAIHILRQKSLAHFFSLYTDLIDSIRSTGIDWLQQIQHAKMHSLVTLIEIRLSIVGNMFYYIFDGLEDLVKRIKSKLEIKYSLAELIWRVRQNNRKLNSRDRADRISRQYEANLHRVAKFKQHQMDTSFLEILQLMETRIQRQADQAAKLKCFKNLTSSSQFQPVKYCWRQIFQKLQVYKRRHHPSNQKQIQRNNFKHIEHHKLMNVNCLGCIKFMYQHSVIQPNDAQLYAVFPYIHRLKQYEAEVKQKINLMMSSGGGVILFDCHPEFFNIRVQGAKMSEKQKEAFEQMLISYLPSFYPRLKMNENVFISFVPIVENTHTKDLSFSYYKGEEGLMKQGQRYIERQYLQGHYVCRVIVRPFEDRRVTFWMQNEGIYQTCHLSINNKEEAFKNLRKHIKKNMASTFSSANQKFIDPNYKKMISYFDDHKCTSTPEQGIPTTNNIKVSQVGQPKSHAKLESEYNYMSIMIARSRHLPDIKQKLKRYGYKFYVDHPFAHYKFKHANHSAVLYHNVKFQTLLNEVCFSKDFIYEGKNILTINVTAYLKFKKRTSDNMLGAQYAQTINDWLHKEFPNEKLRFWEFIAQKNIKEYYLETQSKLSTLFIYHVLQNYGEEVVFKCPNGLDKMSVQERAHRFRQLDILSQSKQYYNEPQPTPQISPQNRVKQTGRDLNKRVSARKPKHL